MRKISKRRHGNVVLTRALEDMRTNSEKEWITYFISHHKLVFAAALSISVLYLLLRAKLRTSGLTQSADLPGA